MSNPPRQKGTQGETELLRLLNEKGFKFVRRPAGARTDLRHEATTKWDGAPILTLLATRPDRGNWLFTIDLETFCAVFAPEVDNIEIEVKRRKKFAHHSLFEKELG